MATKRQRIMYASQTVRAGGHLLYRVQTLGSNTTFNMEDVFEMGHYDIVDVVDDVPAVAVAIDTNDWGSTETMAVLAGMNPSRMVGAPTSSGAYLRTNSVCTGSGTNYYHGVSLADFNLSDGVKIWAPVQNEASFGSLDDDIQMSLFMDKVYVNSITLTYNTGASSTENYAAETDNKMWLINAGRFISQEEWDITTASNSQELYLGIPNSATIPATRNCKYAFLSWTTLGKAGVIVKAPTDRQGTVYEVAAAAASSKFGYNPATQVLTLPTNAATLFTTAIKVVAVYAADVYATLNGNTAASNPAKDSARVYAKYFELASSDVAPDFPAQHNAEGLGAVRQGQVEVYLIDPDQLAGKDNNDWSMSLRMQTVTITATPTRTPLNELGHMRPFARPMNFPIDITVNTTSMASDLEAWATIAGFTVTDYEAGGNKVDIALYHLMAKENLCLVVKVFQQTDDDAGGTGMDRKAMLPQLASSEYYDWNGFGTYPTYDPDTAAHVGSCVGPPRERPLKTIVIPGLKLSAENFNNAVGGGGGGGAGGSATQEMNFRARNKLFVVKGDCSIQDVNCLERNTTALQN
jgi:hypothetical protein